MGNLDVDDEIRCQLEVFDELDLLAGLHKFFRHERHAAQDVPYIAIGSLLYV